VGQQPVPYNSEQKSKFVQCKMGDMRSRLRFLISGQSGVLANVHVELSINFDIGVQPPRSARNQGHDKRGEI